MKYEFVKYHGAGNDFIMIDNRDGLFPNNDIDLISAMCRRRFGIGSDGLILISNDTDSDFYMDFYNPDGSRSFCGNGSRCAVMFAFHLGIIKDKCLFRSIHGSNEAWLVDEFNVKLKMFDVSNVEIGNDHHYMDTGSPHYNLFVTDVDEIDLINVAHQIRFGNRFSKIGTNVNLIEEMDNNTIRVRTYERGVENETLSCGTGVTACAISTALSKGLIENQHINVITKGGKLSVDFVINDPTDINEIYLTGPVEQVFNGIWNG
ncbi:MAG: diaminopimelate epimerase [Flavobacteriales bacterium]|nr:diaminopimelate epimerase [Flavobacteriales bacterium]